MNITCVISPKLKISSSEIFDLFKALLNPVFSSTGLGFDWFLRQNVEVSPEVRRPEQRIRRLNEEGSGCFQDGW